MAHAAGTADAPAGPKAPGPDDGGHYVKTIAMSRRRPELSRDAFREYYETRHAPLAIQHVHFTKYVRNHLIAPSNAAFDIVTEFWLADPSQAAGLDATPVGKMLRADADKFMAVDRFRAIAEESLLAGPPRRYESGRVQKYALLVNRHAYAAEADFMADARDWGRRLARSANAERVTIDVVNPFPGGTFPANAIFWLWLDRAFDVGLTENPPKPIEIAGILTLDAYETPRDELIATL